MVALELGNLSVVARIALSPSLRRVRGARPTVLAARPESAPYLRHRVPPRRRRFEGERLWLQKMRASSISPRTRPCRAHERKSRQGHARRYKTVRATLSNPFSHCTFRTNETCKFRSERRLRVSAKYLIRLGGISPPPRLSPRSAPAPRERKRVYHNFFVAGKRFMRTPP